MSRWRRGEPRAGGAEAGSPCRGPVVVLAEPDPAWRRMAWEELGEVWRVLEAWCVGGVHHVGSTALAEVPARPVIDLWVGLADAAHADEAGAALQAVGWQRARPAAGGVGGDAEALAAGPAYAGTRGDGMAVGVELLAAGGARWHAGLLLRDRLRAGQHRRHEYARVKRRAAARATSLADYHRRKAAFVQRVVAQ